MMEQVGKVADRMVRKMAADMVRQDRRADVLVGDAVATVLVAEGCGQVIWHRGEAGPIAGRALMNDFIGPGMGDQLRALADHVDAAQALLDGGVK